MRSVIVVGSGPAAAGAALALRDVPDLEITVVDVGETLEDHRRDAALALGAQDRTDWDPALVKEIIGQPVAVDGKGLPQKRAYASDFPFRDAGQLTGLSAAGGANADVVSAAYGGFSNVWGAQVMPFARSVTDAWPIGPLEPHYRAVLAEIPYAAESDDLAEHFPLLGDEAPLPHLAPRTARVLGRYARHRARLRERGIRMGKARLALDARRCVGAGLCLTGCPYGLVYSAAHTFDALRRTGRIRYRSGLLATRVVEDGDHARVVARDVGSGTREELVADRVFVACGGIGSARLTAASLGHVDRTLGMVESQQFVIPMLSFGATPDPRPDPGMTLNQFTMTLAEDERAYDLAQIHYYTYNAAFDAALPAPLRWPGSGLLRGQVLRRVTAAIGYLPSWHSPGLELRIGPASDDATLPTAEVHGGDLPASGRGLLRRTLWRLVRAAPLLDLYPFLPSLSVSRPGKSYHFGGSFPHADGPPSDVTTDALGRPGPWRRIHLVDGSVLPSIPATTFTLTVMANAHRIASESVALA
jgi:choline dehydrogenase-like flavoprotein